LLHRPRQGGKGDESRFTMLETIREYAWECLQESGDAPELRKQHAEYYAAMAEKAEPELLGPQQVASMDRLEQEHDNIRAALEWGAETPEGLETGLRLAGSLLWFWQTRGYITE